jgi:hypothetical protein
MPLDYRPLRLTLEDAVVLYDFLSGAQEAEQGIHTDDPAIQLAFWHLLGRLEVEIVENPETGEWSYDDVLARALAELRESAA